MNLCSLGTRRAVGVVSALTATLVWLPAPPASAGFAKIVKCKVPKVVGLKLAKAKSKLVKAHCKSGKVTRKFSSSKKKGKVVGQKPKAGKTLPAGSKVRLTVGKGPRGH